MTSKSIRFQFYSFVAFLLLSLFLLLNIYPLSTSRDAIFEEKKSSMTSRGNAAASALSGLGSLNYESAADILDILDMGSYSRVVVTDSEGLVIYDTDSQSVNGVSSEIEDLLTSLSKCKTIFRSEFKGSSFTSSYTTPMSAQGEITGALYLKEIDTEQGKIILAIQHRIRLITIVISIICLAIAVIFSGTLLSRFTELVNSMRIVASGDFSHRLKIRGNDEVSSLGKEFNELTDRFQSIETQRRQFVSDASHELKTPLASIKLLSDSIAQSDNMDESTVKEFARDIGNQADRLSHITEDLLSLSRLDDDVRLSDEVVDLSRAALDVFTLLEPFARDNGIKIKLSLNDGCVVMATADDIFHIIYNLVDNAIKYNVESGEVHIGTKCTSDLVILTVKDTGIGIPEEERFNIFTRFYRIDKARSRSSGGTGLGLSIVHDAVKAHHGAITVGVNSPSGSVFTISFPRPTEDQTGL